MVCLCVFYVESTSPEGYISNINWLQKRYIKKFRSRSDCFFRSSLIRVFPFCYSNMHFVKLSPDYQHFFFFGGGGVGGENRKRKVFKIREHLPLNLIFYMWETPKWVLLQTVKTQMKCCIMRYFIRVYTVC